MREKKKKQRKREREREKKVLGMNKENVFVTPSVLRMVTAQLRTHARKK